MQHQKRQHQVANLPAPAWLMVAVLLASPALGDDVGSAAAHDEIGCGVCHGAVGSPADASAAAMTGDHRSSRCAACHGRRRASRDPDNPFHLRQSGSCVRCHSFHEPAVVRAGDREFEVTFGDANIQAHCRSCHAPEADVRELAGGHRFAADAVYHTDAFDLADLTPSDGCLLCHDRGSEAIDAPADIDPAPRFHTEASHVYGVRVSTGRGTGAARIRPDIDPRIPLPGGMIECQTCHRVTAGTKKLLIPFEDPYGLCLGCHEVRQHQPEGVGPVASSAGDKPLKAAGFSR